MDAIREFAWPGSTVLELGAGTGRLTRVLLDWGTIPTAVDSSNEMLAHIPAGVDRICSTIEVLDLSRTFDTVLLASCLINHPEKRVRQSFIQCAARHLRRGGRLILERHDPQWLLNAIPGRAAAAGPAVIFVEHVARTGGCISMRLHYETQAHSWTQEFLVAALGEQEIERELAQLGFTDVSWHGPTRRLAVALWENKDAN
ncbi:class I SAM-dependent methyltransferase [Ramlibacter aquaticus]|uniref:Class I SAM-dependent methyltransferase n=1 Tax=Ramlibacter aquaticus TaxID=2780094 RepID=A0ABR9SEQ5_9BURK|nr:class I SAM-dependent methyltransferase [Ramlibacter aquaticus]